MHRSLLALVLLLTTVAAGTPSVPTGWSSAVQVLEAQPDTRKAKPLGWPNAQDIAKLKSLEGKTKWKVIQVLGHPSAVRRRPDGTEVWDYPWCAACRVWIKNGVCTGTFYTGGY